jgi:cytoplasmic iron level regulating protein YaaA (DUF328/UPF0246 family)
MIAIVQCGKAKLAYPAPAQVLYTGGIFRALRPIAERQAERWYILSAKHGLLQPSRVIAPYDVKMPTEPDREWVETHVLRPLREWEPKVREILALCSERYCGVWVDEMRARGIIVETPIRGLTLGAIMSKAIELRRRA